MEDTYVIWAVVCFSIAFALFVLELLIPSGGLLGLGCAICLIAGVVVLFMVDTTLGLVGAIITLAAVPIMIALALKIWPNTPIARMLTLYNEEPETVDPAVAATAVKAGDRGKSVTGLRPVGACVINGKRIDCLAVRGTIDTGKPVEVIAVDGMQIKVREVDG